MSEIRWLHRPSGTLCKRVGEDRDTGGSPYVVMETPDGARARIDPLALMRVDGDWERVTPAEHGAERSADDERASGSHWCRRCARYRDSPVCPRCGSETDLT